ncbi:MAG: cysteine synthase A [Euryarchaeota archaeon]|nr:cysteine synthase A [Euryarchaeota archaeon]
MIKLNRIVDENSSQIYVKLESFNPMHSVKDRVAYSMIETAERNGTLRPGMYVVEPTSGNTGIGLAMVCAAKGYRLVITMPETMSVERQRLMAAFGTEVILTPGSEGMKGAILRAEEIVNSDDNAFMPQQFVNPANPDIHQRKTADEILTDLPDLDAFVSAVGTGGTITGVGRALKERKCDVELVAVEPSASPVLSGGKPGPHRIQGIGAGFIPGTCDLSLIDHVLQVDDLEAIKHARELARKEGILCGISSGAALCGAMNIAKELGPDAKVVALLADTGERYLSTELFSME